MGRTRSTFAEQLLCRTVLSRLGSELPESRPTLLVSGGPGSQLCLWAPSQGQDAGPPGVWGVWDTPRSYFLHFRLQAVSSWVFLFQASASLFLERWFIFSLFFFLSQMLIQGGNPLHKQSGGHLQMQERPGSSLESASPVVRMHVSTLPHIQNLFKGRKCLSWNMFHKVNPNLNQDARVTSSRAAVESHFASQIHLGSSQHCSASATPASVSSWESVHSRGVPPAL